MGDTLIPTAGTLFSGDQVQTNLGSAIIQYQRGARVQLGTETTALFTSSQAQLQKGRMLFRTVSGNGPAFAASTLRLEPATTNTVVHVTLEDNKTANDVLLSRPLESGDDESLYTKQLVERGLEDKVQSLLDGLIGPEQSMVRVSVDLDPPTDPRSPASISRISMALTIDSMKTAFDEKTNKAYETRRTPEELGRLTELTRAAVGFNAQRGDFISVHAVRFDKSQEILRRDAAQRYERKVFWTNASSPPLTASTGTSC